MNSEQRNVVDMLYRLDDILEKYKQVYEGNKVFKLCRVEFDNILSDVEDAIDVQNKPSTVSTKQRDAKRVVLVDRVTFTSNRLMSYAAVINDEDMRKRFYKSTTEYQNLKDQDLESYTRIVIAEAKSHEAVLRDYSITPEYMATVQTALNEFAEAVPQARMARLNVRIANETIASLIKKMLDLLILRMDLDIEVFKATNLDFHTQYNAARKIDKRGSRVTMLNVYVYDAASQEPIRAAFCYFELSTDKNKVIEKRTAEKGGLRIGSLTEGIYTLRVEKTGYQTKTLTITAIKGERTVIEVDLVKI